MCGQGWESYRTRKLRKKKVLVSFSYWSPFCLKLLQYFHLVLLIKCLQKGFFWYWTWVSFMLLGWITKFFRANPLATWFTACTTPGHEANSPGRLVGCVSGCPSCTQALNTGGRLWEAGVRNMRWTGGEHVVSLAVFFVSPWGQQPWVTERESLELVTATRPTPTSQNFMMFFKGEKC